MLVIVVIIVPHSSIPYLPKVSSAFMNWEICFMTNKDPN